MIDTLLRILALMRKELLATLMDPKSRASMIGPPLMQCLIFGYAATYDLNRVPYAVLDEDNSFESRELLARFDGSPTFERAATLANRSQLAGLVDQRRAVLVLSLQPGFAEALSAGRQAPLQVILDGRNSNTAGTALGYVNAIVSDFNARWQESRGAGAARLRVTSRAWFNPNLETRWFMVPSLIATLTLIQALLLTAMSVAREREEGTFDQLLVTPFRPVEIMAGKAVPPLVIGLVQATAILLIAQFWFRIPFAGSYLKLYAGLLLFLSAAVGIGLLISSVSSSMQQALLFTFMTVVPCVLLSGLTAPIFNMPPALQALTQLNPLRHGIRMILEIYLEGAGFTQVWPCMAALAALSAVTLPISSWLFRHRLA